MPRTLTRIVTTPTPTQGFIGPGHLASLVVDPSEFERQDPFIVLADDRIDLPAGQTAGGEHPHAGFETVTFVLEGILHDADEGVTHEGDVVWMTAGRGVIHNEHVVPQGRTRILQLWLTLPPRDRWTEPRFEILRRDEVPVRREPGVTVHLYSGQSGDARSATHNFVPVLLADVALHAGAVLDQELPASYNGFVYVIDGSVRIGDDTVEAGQVGWLDRPADDEPSTLRIDAGPGDARLMLYAGEPQGAPIVMHGPFVGETRADIMRASNDYLAGTFARMSALVRATT
jgi:hypothetical protein